VFGTSEVEISWEVEEGVEGGRYRIGYFGASKTPVSGDVVQFQGVSGVFDVG